MSLLVLRETFCAYQASEPTSRHIGAPLASSIFITVDVFFEEGPSSTEIAGSRNFGNVLRPCKCSSIGHATTTSEFSVSHLGETKVQRSHTAQTQSQAGRARNKRLRYTATSSSIPTRNGRRHWLGLP